MAFFDNIGKNREIMALKYATKIYNSFRRDELWYFKMQHYIKLKDGYMVQDGKFCCTRYPSGLSRPYIAQSNGVLVTIVSGYDTLSVERVMYPRGGEEFDKLYGRSIYKYNIDQIKKALLTYPYLRYYRPNNTDRIYNLDEFIKKNK